ncbi:nuclear hormone receptor-like 1 [Centruroides sculpturatus]|uniref:nuclear hormone receptor-like 1 n=1 Tax=Centruroides sculpturatus TaxID=218467 RepID=UPI000C6CE975|nr:nuclear hormone receptor-like 1 [Centruroides sculpturatus]
MDKRKTGTKEDQDGVALHLTPIRDTCEVCGDNDEVSNRYGAFTCDSCSNFFRKCILDKRRVIHCITESGKCPIDKRSGVTTCGFCRLNKCYDVGMNFNLARVKPKCVRQLTGGFGVSERRSKLLENLSSTESTTKSFREIATEYLFDRKKACIECLQYMEQYYYKWLNTFPRFHNLSKDKKELVRSRSSVKGAIMQLIERSLCVYLMLRLHNCFLYTTTTSDKISAIIKSTRDFRDDVSHALTESEATKITKLEAFNIMKLQLTMNDDLLILKKDLDLASNLQSSFQRLINTVSELTNAISCFRNRENFDAIESLNLFDYSSDIPEGKYPYNQIRFCPQL